ncbi:hypothetical protein TNCV_1708381 [Trichonephila clavipes]|nr:hypothetical protein TNCV_1708381 [Trichonephila clavipes]
MWVEAMRLLEDTRKNGWTVADFSVLIVAVDLGPQQIRRIDLLSDRLSQRLIHLINHQTSDPPTSVHHDHSQTADRAKFMLVLIAMLPATPACPLSSQIT